MAHSHEEIIAEWDSDPIDDEDFAKRIYYSLEADNDNMALHKLRKAFAFLAVHLRNADILTTEQLRSIVLKSQS